MIENIAIVITKAEGISRVLLAANFKNFKKGLGMRDRILRMSSDYFNFECMYKVLLGAQKMVSYKSLYMLFMIAYTQIALQFPILSLSSPIPANVFEFIKAPANFELDTEF